MSLPSKDIDPTVDALDEYLKQHSRETIGPHRDRIVRCMNRAVNPTKPFDKRHIYDSWGCVIAMKCYASKRWIPFEGPKAAKFGVRKKHKSGFNKMTIKARKVWETYTHEYNRISKEADALCLEGKITEDEKYERMSEAAQARFKAFENWDEGFASMDECFKYLREHGLLV